MKPFYILTMATFSSVLVGCAVPRQSMVNYGHPALNQPMAVQNELGKVATGAIVGGLIGSRFGQGDGRVAAAAVGAAVGSMTAQGSYSNDATGGALLGGLLGSRFGQGNGRIAGAALGAGLGAWLAVPRE